jgi:cell division protein FtsB
VKALAAILAVLVLALQYPLWIGKGGWMRVWELERSVEQQNEHNARLKARNDALDAEVRDLKEGNEAIEERARLELGMVKRDETFYQVVSAEAASPASRPAPGSDRAPPPRSSPGER